MAVDLHVLGLWFEDTACHGIKQIIDIQKRRQAENNQYHHHAGICRARHQIEFRPAATKRRNADDRQRAKEERPEQPRHFTSLPVKVRNFRDVRLHIDGTGNKEQCDLARRVHDDVKRSACGRHLRCDRGAKNDIGQLADRRIGKPRFQIILGDRHTA